MKKKLFKSFSWTIITIIILTSVATTFVFYRSHKAAHENRIKQIANFFSTIPSDNNDIYSKAKKSFSGMRITLIDTEGKVIFETNEDKLTMENHDQRTEFIQAKRQGFGEAVRKSETLGENYYYYAVLLDNGNILRIAEPQANIYKSFLNIFAPIIMILLLAYIAAFYIAHRVSKNIVSDLKTQVEGIESGNYNEGVYTELYPIKRFIEDQSEELNIRIENLDQYKDTMNQILRNMTDGFLFVDEINRVKMYNNRAIEFFGKDLDGSYANKSVFYLSRDETFMNIFAENNIYKNEKVDLDINQNKIRITVSSVINKGEFLGRIIILRDITEEKILERERREFTSNITHDLKTPLTSINGYAELLSQDRVAKEDVSKIGKVILNEGHRLLGMVDSVMELSKIEEKKIQNKEEIDVREMVLNTIELFKPKLKEKNISIKTNIESVRYRGVKEVIRAVIYNLFDNAIKYGKNYGNIEIQLLDRDYYFIFQVKDDGLGISEKDKEKIFRRFYVADQSRHRNDSNGIGLSIVKHGVEAMGGQIFLESKLGHGSTFSIEIPYE